MSALAKCNVMNELDGLIKDAWYQVYDLLTTECTFPVHAIRFQTLLPWKRFIHTDKKLREKRKVDEILSINYFFLRIGKRQPSLDISGEHIGSRALYANHWCKTKDLCEIWSQENYDCY